MAFKEWIIEPSRRGLFLKENQVSVLYTPHAKNPTYTITFSADLSEKAFNAGMTTMVISQDDITSEIALVLRKENNGFPLRLNGANAHCRGNLQVASRGLIERLLRELKLPEGRNVLTISPNKSKRDDVMFFLINQPNQ